MTPAATTTRPATRRPNSANTPKHAFALVVAFDPRNRTAGNVTLPAQSHNLDLWPVGYASGTSRHDFYVSVGAGSQTAVLVHNCPGSGDIHGDLNSESRGIDVENVRTNGDTAYQVSETETRAVNILNNGNGTNDIVIDRLGAQAGDSPITAFQSTDDEVAGKFARGTWQWNLG
jgi:hypothetical protein